MSQSELQPSQVALNVIMADDPNLPIQHVNALSLRSSSDEFYFTLGVVLPPDLSEIATAKEIGHIEAKPVFRFALSRDTMEKFLALMASQYDQQTTIINRSRGISVETSKEEIRGDG